MTNVLFLTALRFLLVFQVVILLFQNRNLMGDGESRFAALTALLERGELIQTKYSLIGPLFAAPLWWLGQWLATPADLVINFSWIVFAVGLWILLKILKSVLNDTQRLVFGILLCSATMIPFHLRSFYGEVLSMMLTAIGSAALICIPKPTRFQKSLSILCLAISAANAPATLPALFLMGVAVAKTKNKHLLSSYFRALFFAGFFICIENLIRRGSLFQFGYDMAHEINPQLESVIPSYTGFALPLVIGLIGLLFSTGKGILFFMPALFLRTEKDLLLKAWLFFVLGLVLVYSKWWAWHGGWFWGPRFLLFASLPVALILTRAKLSTVTLFVLAWSMWVGLNGVVFGQTNLDLCFVNDRAKEYLCWWTPEYSPLFRPFISTHELLKMLASSKVFFVFNWFIVFAVLIFAKRRISRSH